MAGEALNQEQLEQRIASWKGQEFNAAEKVSEALDVKPEPVETSQTVNPAPQNIMQPV